jgi:alpha-mannosidase
MWHIFLID